MAMLITYVAEWTLLMQSIVTLVDCVAFVSMHVFGHFIVTVVWVFHVTSVAVNNFKFYNIETESIDLHSFDLLCLPTEVTMVLF